MSNESLRFYLCLSPCSSEWYVDINVIDSVSSPGVPFKTTLRVRDCCLCLHLQRAARAQARRFDDALRPLGLTNGQFSILMSLNRSEPAGMASVASLLAMDRTTLTAALKPLERRKLIKITTDRFDRRSRRLSLTAKGKARLASALPIWEQTHREVESLLTDIDPDQLRRSLLALS
ncbi:MAG TPA: MarR family winged helix-turn-helix transcriptional regulator [Alloacidobacterium sp.]|nr:MarR family winged helix-turn-helix transcriptional regulator [Alloacidobacterium sp.]